MAKLTDKTEFTGTVSGDDLVHIVIVSDTTDSPDGSSFKAPLSVLAPYFSGSSTSSSLWVEGGLNNSSLNDSKGGHTVDTNSNKSIIAGGDGNTMFANTSFIGGGQSNIITSIANSQGGSSTTLSAIIGGQGNSIEGESQNSSGVFCGGANVINGFDSDYSAILAGRQNTLTTSSYAVIMGGRFNKINAVSRYSGILGGESNEIISGNTHSVMIGGEDNVLNANHSAIIGGENNLTVSYSDNGVIIGGENNVLGVDASSPPQGFTAFPSPSIGTTLTSLSVAHGLSVGDEVLISGASAPEYNTTHIVTDIGSTTQFTIDVIPNITGFEVFNIQPLGQPGGGKNSVIIGGQNITGTSDNTVYVPNLNIGTVGSGTTINDLGIDADGNVVVGSSGGGYWVNGSSGTFSIKVDNDSGLDATGDYSHAEGQNTLASGESSHAEGENTEASAENSHAEGYQTTASGDASHAEGHSTTASGGVSHAEGNNTTASGHISHAQGNSTLASGDASHAGGYQSTASGDTSFIHSRNSIVLGERSVVLGGENITGSTSDTVYVPRLNVVTAGEGIILTSPDGTTYKLTISNAGALEVSLLPV